MDTWIEKLLWLASSGLMAALLILLALRALRQLLGVRLRLPAAPEAEAPADDALPAPWPVIFLTALPVLWLGALAAHCAVNGSPAGFFAHYLERFTQAGDSPRYIFIAENGYVRSGDQVNNIVFYPLYPFLMGLLGRLLGGRTALAGMLISQVCYGSSAVVLTKLAKKECAHPGAALAGYLLYPFGFFCQGVFTEGLFLLLTVSGLYLIRQKRWLAAGAVGFLTALTRTQGMLLLLPGVYCAWLDCREQRRWDWRYLALAGPAAGFGIYLCVNKAVCGGFFAYQYYESIAPWWQTPQWLGRTLAQQYSMAMQYPDLAKWIYWPQMELYFIAAALLFLGFYRRLDTPWLLYGTAYLGMSYTAAWLISGGRYMLGCLPLYLCLGRIKNSAARYLVLAAELAAFWQMYVWFMQNQAIM